METAFFVMSLRMFTAHAESPHRDENPTAQGDQPGYRLARNAHHHSHAGREARSYKTGLHASSSY